MKNRVYPVALSLAVWSIPASAAWTNVSNGLTGSVPGVAALAIDLSVGSTLYALTSANVIFKSTDWSPINQGLDQIVAAHAPINAVLLHPDRTDVLYLATSGYGVFRSTDGGATWAAFNDGLPFLDVRSLALSHRDSAAHPGRRSGVLGSNTLYAGTPGGVFKIQ